MSYFMEQVERQLLNVESQLLQSLLGPVQVQQVEADGRNAREHVRREQVGDQEVARFTEGTEEVYRKTRRICRHVTHFHVWVSGFEDQPADPYVKGCDETGEILLLRDEA